MYIYSSEFLAVISLISLVYSKSPFNHSENFVEGVTFSECSGEVTDPGTEITSENYPEAYLGSQDCWVNVRFEEEEKVELTFLDFDVQGKSSLYNSGCSGAGDYLEL